MSVLTVVFFATFKRCLSTDWSINRLTAVKIEIIVIYILLLLFTELKSMLLHLHFIHEEKKKFAHILLPLGSVSPLSPPSIVSSFCRAEASLKPFSLTGPRAACSDGADAPVTAIVGECGA